MRKNHVRAFRHVAAGEFQQYMGLFENGNRLFGSRRDYFPPWRLRLRLCLALLVIVSIALAVGQRTCNATTVIGPETLLPPPVNSAWGGIVNIRPANNAVVTINPPQFSWFAEPGDGSAYLTNNTVYYFQFQCEYDPSFTNPIVNVTTPSDCYNFVAPFTNSPVYWRVGYINYTNGNTDAWRTNTFTIAANATNWDRSMLANPAYWAVRTAHPHLFWNATNAANVARFISLNFSSQWLAFSNTAYGVTTQKWWTTPTPWSGSAATLEAQAVSVADVAMMYGLTQNPYWTNGLVTNCMNLFNAWTNTGAWKIDYGNSGGDISWLLGTCLTYDNAYSLLNTNQINSCLTDLHFPVRTFLYDGSWVTTQNIGTSFYPEGNSDATGVYPPPFYVPYPLLQKHSDSHNYANITAIWLIALTCYGDSYTNSSWPVWIPGYTNDATAYCELYLNYLIGRLSPHGRQMLSGGRAYDSDEMWDNGFLMWDLMLANTTFPEAMMNPHPDFAVVADSFCRIQPPGYGQVQEAWGDYIARFNYFFREDSKGERLSLLSQSGNVRQVWEASKALYGWSGYENDLTVLAPFYYFSLPSPTIDPTLATCYADEGWVTSAAYPFNTAAAFTNGVGFVFAARSTGLSWNHDYPNDDDVEIWAYGANVTDCAGSGTGATYQAKPTWSHNNIVINGAGQYQPNNGQLTATPAKIIAFTNAPDYAYCAGDATYSYPHVPVDSYDQFFETTPAYSGFAEKSGPLLTKAQRHVLFPHHQYLVIYDDLAASTNVTFSWVWHVFQDTVSNLSNGSFNYSVPVTAGNGNFGWAYPWSSVQVYVQQMVNPTLLICTNMHGANAYSNPVTGENYWSYALSDLQNNGMALYTNSVWVANATPTNQFHFMTVVYPVVPGSPAPTITRMDDYTVQVQSGTNTDVISFDASTKLPASMIVNIAGGGVRQPLAPASNLRVNSP